MDYLRKNCKNDIGTHEKMQMVALKFGMYRELAKAKEDQALRDMKRLKHKSFGKRKSFYSTIHCICSRPYLHTCMFYLFLI